MSYGVLCVSRHLIRPVIDLKNGHNTTIPLDILSFPVNFHFIISIKSGTSNKKIPTKK